LAENLNNMKKNKQPVLDARKEKSLEVKQRRQMWQTSVLGVTVANQNCFHKHVKGLIKFIEM
jgi:hypothetical protein